MKLNEILTKVINRNLNINNIEVYNDVERQSERMIFNYAIRKKIPVHLEVDDIKSIVAYSLSELFIRFKEGFEPISYYWKILITTFIVENMKKQKLIQSEISNEQKGANDESLYLCDIIVEPNDYDEEKEHIYYRKKIKKMLLTERQKEILLYVLEGYSYEQIGKLINTSRQNINQTLKKLHKKDEIRSLLNR